MSKTDEGWRELSAEERVARAILAMYEPADAMEFVGYLGVVISL